MKEQYKWNYNIKIKTKEETFEYEKETLDNIDLLLQKHPDYEEVQAKQVANEVANSGKRLVKKIGTNNKYNSNR